MRSSWTSFSRVMKVQDPVCITAQIAAVTHNGLRMVSDVIDPMKHEHRDI